MARRASSRRSSRPPRHPNPTPNPTPIPIPTPNPTPTPTPKQATEAVLRIARTQHPKEAARAQKVAVERRKTAELKTALQGGALPADAQRTVKVAAEDARW